MGKDSQMFSFDVKEQDVAEAGKRKRKYAIINGIEDTDSWYHSRGLYFNNKEFEQILLSCTHEEIGEYLDHFEYSSDLDALPHGDIRLKVFSSGEYFDEHIPRVDFEFRIAAEEWNRPWSIMQFFEEFKYQVAKYGDSRIVHFVENDDYPMDDWGVSLNSVAQNYIGKDIEHLKKVSVSLLQKTTEELLKKINGEALLSFFQFKKGTEIACKQYLLYFVQFLADLGIQASSELTDELSTRTTLLKVVPKNKGESLRNIKDALDAYLSAVEAAEMDLIQSSPDIAVSQFQANLFFLKSQLEMSKALLSAKDAQIEALQLSNLHYRNQLMISPPANPGNSKTDGEDLIENIVTITKYEGKGFTVNLPEILKRLKRMF